MFNFSRIIGGIISLKMSFLGFSDKKKRFPGKNALLKYKLIVFLYTRKGKSLSLPIIKIHGKTKLLLIFKEIAKEYYRSMPDIIQGECYKFQHFGSAFLTTSKVHLLNAFSNPDCFLPPTFHLHYIAFLGFLKLSKF